MVLGCQHIRRGIGVVEVKDDFVLIQNRLPNFAKGLDGQRRGVVVTHDVVHIQQQNFSGLHTPAARCEKISSINVPIASPLDR